MVNCIVCESFLNKLLKNKYHTQEEPKETYQLNKYFLCLGWLQATEDAYQVNYKDN